MVPDGNHGSRTEEISINTSRMHLYITYKRKSDRVINLRQSTFVKGTLSQRMCYTYEENKGKGAFTMPITENHDLQSENMIVWYTDIYKMFGTYSSHRGLYQKDKQPRKFFCCFIQMFWLNESFSSLYGGYLKVLIKK